MITARKNMNRGQQPKSVTLVHCIILVAIPITVLITSYGFKSDFHDKVYDLKSGLTDTDMSTTDDELNDTTYYPENSGPKMEFLISDADLYNSNDSGDLVGMYSTTDVTNVTTFDNCSSGNSTSQNCSKENADLMYSVVFVATGLFLLFIGFFFQKFLVKTQMGIIVIDLLANQDIHSANGQQNPPNSLRNTAASLAKVASSLVNGSPHSQPIPIKTGSRYDNLYCSISAETAVEFPVEYDSDADSYTSDSVKESEILGGQSI